MRDGELQIVHTADWHLGNLFRNQPTIWRQRLQEQGMNNLIALREQLAKQPADLLTFAGDTFQNSRAEHSDPALFLRLLGRFQARHIVILPGNHDPYFQGGIWAELEPQLPAHVLLVRGQQAYYDLPDIGVRLFAEPYLTRLAPESLYADTLETSSAATQILLAHAEVLDRGQGSNYQPLSRDWLRSQNLDLILLGHIHQRSVEELGPRRCPAIYAGSATACDQTEVGPRGSYRIVYDQVLRQVKSIDFQAFETLTIHSLDLDLGEIADQDLADLSTSPQKLAELLLNLLRGVEGLKLERDIIHLRVQGVSSEPLPLDLVAKDLQSEGLALTLVDELRLRGSLNRGRNPFIDVLREVVTERRQEAEQAEERRLDEAMSLIISRGERR